MNVAYAITAIPNLISQYRSDQDYSDTTNLETNFNDEATRNGTTVVAYAISDPAALLALCALENWNVKLQIMHKEDAPPGSTIVPPEGVLLADIPNDGFVVVYVP